MTVRGKFILALAVASPVSMAFAQQSAAPLTTSRPRSTYDPAAKAGAPTDTTSAVEKALHAVNPQDKDYGLVLQSVRLLAIEETIQNFLWWADVVLLAGFSLSLAGNYWQHLRSEDRLRISSAIVAQLHNSHVASRAKALEAIDKHNQLADLYNEKCDAESKTKELADAAEQKKAAKGESRKAVEAAEQLVAGNRADPSTSTPRETQGASSPTVPESAPQSPMSETDETKRLKAQLTARDQKINNLRAQLNQAHQRLEDERKRSPSTANA
jgi:hypothetical protein